MAPDILNAIPRVIRNPRLWIIVALFAGGVILHYPQQLPFWGGLETPSSILGLTRHTVERVYLLAPIIYAGFTFGIRGGIASLIVALGIMLPRAILISPCPPDALLETGGIISIGTAVNLIFHTHRRKQASLKTEGEKWHSSFNALEDMMLIIDRDYNVENINDSGLALLGKSREEVVGKKCYQIIRDRDGPDEECPCRRTLETKQVESAEWYEEQIGRYFLIKTSPIFDENGEIIKFVDLRRDITELKRAEEMLTKIVDGTSISSFVINRNHKVTHWNTAVEALTGIRKEEIVGTDEQWRAFWPERRPVMADLIVDGASSDEIEGYYRGRCQKSPLIDGAYEAEVYYPELGKGGKWLHFTASPIKDRQGKIIGAIETLQDVTRRKKAEHALNERMRELQCLHDIGNIAQRPEIALDDVYEEVANLLPAAWQYHEIACARIAINGKEFKTENYRETEWKQSSAIKVHRKKAGVVEVTYLEEQPDADEGPFLKEERLLIDAVAERLGRITERKEIEENLRHYLREITKAQEEERKRIARELHDSTAQTLIALLHQLENLLGDKAEMPVREAKALWGFYEQIRDVLREVRRFSRDLRPSILDDLGLLPALEWVIGELQKEYGVKATLKVVGDERRFPPEAELLLFRVVQEALRNITKHAHASTAEVKLKFDKKKIRVTIRDDGIGFRPPESLGELLHEGKFGLAGVEERVHLLNGSIKIKSKPGKGTRVTIEVPM